MFRSCGKRFALLDSSKNKSEKDVPKKKKKLEAELMGVSREFSFKVRVVTSVFTFGILAGLYKYLSAHYSGVVVGKLPFHSPTFLHRMTHMTLEGEDYLECSALFIYLLSKNHNPLIHFSICTIASRIKLHGQDLWCANKKCIPNFQTGVTVTGNVLSMGMHTYHYILCSRFSVASNA
jgi:hypothetical protein